MSTPLIAGRYALHAPLASGGMAQLHLGVARGAVGFTRVVAIKRLHAKFATDKDFVTMLVDEARLAGRIRHPNVIPILDVVAEQSELFVVMEYVDGEALSKLITAAIKSGEAIPLPIAIDIGIAMLDGLHAAHEARSEKGDPLNIVHRDVSPQNVLVGVDGITRVFDFGVAKAESRIYESMHGTIRGKVAYMAPEQIKSNDVDRRADVWAAAVVLWEVLARRRLFVATSAPEYMDAILTGLLPRPSVYSDCPPVIDDIIMKGLERDPEKRWQTALDMATALQDAGRRAHAREVGAWVEASAIETLKARRTLIEQVELDPLGGSNPSLLRQIAALAEGNVTAEKTERIPEGHVPTAELAPVFEPTGALDLPPREEPPHEATPLEPEPPAPTPSPNPGRILSLALGLTGGLVAATVLLMASRDSRPTPPMLPVAPVEPSVESGPPSLEPKTTTEPPLPELDAGVVTTSVSAKPTPKKPRPSRPGSSTNDPLDLDDRR